MAGCLPLAILLGLPRVSGVKAPLAEIAPVVVAEVNQAGELHESTKTSPAILGNLTLFDLPEQRNAPEAEAPSPPFRLLAIEPEMRSTIVSGHVFDGRSWRVTLRDVDLGVWETLRPGEESERLGVKLIRFKEEHGAPTAMLEDLQNGERWEATDRKTASGRFLAVIGQVGSERLLVTEGSPIAGTRWSLSRIADDAGAATFTHAGGNSQTLLPERANAQPAFEP